MSEDPTISLTLSKTAFDPGGDVKVSGHISPWPLSKFNRVGIDMGYDASKDPAERDLFYRGVDGQRVEASDVDAVGDFSIGFRVPLDGPPSEMGGRTSKWQIRARLFRSGGRDVTTQIGFSVGALSTGALRLQRERLILPVDHRARGFPAFAPTEDDNAPLGGFDFNGQDLALRLDRDVVPRGEALRGEIVITLDPMGYLEKKQFPSERQKQKALKKASSITELKVVALGTARRLSISAPAHSSFFLGCDTSSGRYFDVHTGFTFESPLGRSEKAGVWDCLRDIPLDLPSTIRVGTEYQVPFEIGIPTILEYDEPFSGGVGVSERPTLPTYYGRHDEDGAQRDEHFRWLVVLALGVEAKGLHPWYSGIRGVSKDSPLRATTEIIVT